MNKKIWLWNHYATDMYKNQGGRHYWFAKNLIAKGYEVTVFCASTIHNSDENIVIKDKKYLVDTIDGIPFVFIKTPSYTGNGTSRILNMLAFYKNLFPVSRDYGRIYGKPDIILASSVHPLTLVAGIKIAKRFGVPCICEIRDLWPESLAAYGIVKNKALLNFLYACEKWIYKRADKLIFLMEGGKDYIIEKGWDNGHGGPIDLSKVYHINNGVDFETFNNNRENNVIADKDLENEQTFKVIYAGSIRLVNNLRSVVDAAKVICRNYNENIKFLIYGDGSDRKDLEKYCAENKIENVVFKGFVDKKYIPYILSKSNLNIIHFEQNSLKKYGVSLNKMFEYFASGKPVISDCEFGYDLIKKYNCGIVVDNANAGQLAEAIVRFSKMADEEYAEYCRNALSAARDYDFKMLTDKLVNIFN